MATEPARGDARPLSVSHWPHLVPKASVPEVMGSVVAALAPAAVMAGYVFGMRAWMHMALGVATAMVVEAAVQRFRGRPVTLGDGSAAVTGLLVAFCLPAQARWFVPVVASGVAIAIAKHCFGGLGSNIWNPALVGRAFVHNAFPVDMNPSTYPVLQDGHFSADVGTALAGVPEGVDAVTAATPLAHMKALATGDLWVDTAPAELAERLPSLWRMFIGTIGGNIGETSALLLLVGAAYLIYKGWVRWQVPVAYVGTVALGALVLPIALTAPGGDTVWRPVVAAEGGVALRFVLYHLFGGGLMLGALYMATDMVTTPLTNKGLWVFGVGCGVLTILIRLYGGYPEGVCYSILLMNTAVPLIDRWTVRRIFGHPTRTFGKRKEPAAA